MVIEELITVLGFRQDGTAALESYKRGLSSAALSIGALARRATIAAAAITAASVAMGAGLIRFVKPVAEEYDKLIKTADRVGVSFQKLQELGFAAEQSGTTMDGLARGLEEITKRLGEASRGTGRAKLALDDFGISATTAGGEVKKADDFLLELSEKFETLSEAQQLDLAAKLGLDQGMITMLKAGRKGIEELMEQKRRLGTVDEQQARSAEKFNDQLNATVTGIKNIRDRIALSLLPAMTRWLKIVEDWVVANREMLTAGIERAVRGFARLFETITKLGVSAARTIAWLANEIERISGISFSTLLGAGGFAVLVRRHPLIAFALALLAILDDIRVFMSGEGKSVIGELVEQFNGFAESFPGLAAAITEVGGALFFLVSGLFAFRLAVAGLKTAGATLAGIFSFMGGGAATGAAAGAAAGAGAGAGAAAATGGTAGALARTAALGARIKAALGVVGRVSGWLTVGLVAWRARAGLADAIEEGLKGNIFGGFGSGGQGGFLDRFLYSIGESAAGLIYESFTALFGEGAATGPIDRNAPGSGPRPAPPPVGGSDGTMEWVPGIGYVVRPQGGAWPPQELTTTARDQAAAGMTLITTVQVYGQRMAQAMAASIGPALASILSAAAGPLSMLGGALGITAQAAPAPVINRTVTVTVSAPVNITMNGSAATPGAVGAATSSAITGAANRAADILASEPAADASPALGAQGAAS